MKKKYLTLGLFLWIFFSYSFSESDLETALDPSSPSKMYQKVNQYYDGKIQKTFDEAYNKVWANLGSDASTLKAISAWDLSKCKDLFPKLWIKKRAWWYTEEDFLICQKSIDQKVWNYTRTKLNNMSVEDSTAGENILADGDEENWPYDLLVDMKNISKILFKEEIEFDTKFDVKYKQDNWENWGSSNWWPSNWWGNNKNNNSWHNDNSWNNWKNNWWNSNSENNNSWNNWTWNNNNWTWNNQNTSKKSNFQNPNLQFGNICTTNYWNNNWWNNNWWNNNWWGNWWWNKWNNDDWFNTFSWWGDKWYFPGGWSWWDGGNWWGFVPTTWNFNGWWVGEWWGGEWNNWWETCPPEDYILAICIKLIPSGPKWPVGWTVHKRSIQEIVQKTDDTLKEMKDENFISLAWHGDESLDIDYKHIELWSHFAIDIVLMKKAIFDFKKDPTEQEENLADTNCKWVPRKFAKTYKDQWIWDCFDQEADRNRYLITNTDFVKPQKRIKNNYNEKVNDSSSKWIYTQQNIFSSFLGAISDTIDSLTTWWKKTKSTSAYMAEKSKVK